MKKKFNFAFFDEGSKREIRRSILKAIAIPGYQVPFASREMPVARGWGTGGIQLTLSCIGQKDVVKVIDQGSDESVNAISIKKLIHETTSVELTNDVTRASIVQSRHRIPEEKMGKNKLLVLQVPTPEPLRDYEPSETKTKILHGEKEYTGAKLLLFEQIMKYGTMATGADHPVEVHDRYVMAPSPIPKFDNPKMNYSESIILLGAGREKKIYAVPPFTKVVSLDFEDVPFEVENFGDKHCKLCGCTHSFLDEVIHPVTSEVSYQCNDTSYCLKRRNGEL